MAITSEHEDNLTAVVTADDGLKSVAEAAQALVTSRKANSITELAFIDSLNALIDGDKEAEQNAVAGGEGKSAEKLHFAIKGMMKVNNNTGPWA